MLRTAPFGRALTIPCAFLQFLSDSPETDRQRVRQRRKKGAASPYQCPPPAPAAASHRGYGALRSLPLSRWSFYRSLWALRPDAAPRPALWLRAYSRFSEAAAPPPTGRHASRWGRKMKPAAPANATGDPSGAGPPHFGSSGRTALRASACRQPVPPFGRPLATLTIRKARPRQYAAKAITAAVAVPG